MGIAVGALELNSIASGINAGDAMLKAAQVSLIMAQPVCAGKYILIITGDTASVETSIKTGIQEGGVYVVDQMIIPSIDPSVIKAIAGATDVPQQEAVGIIETFSLASSIVAADTAVKAAAVDLIEVRLGRGLGGKSFVIITGSVSEVKASANAAKGRLGEDGMMVNSVVIPNLHPDMFREIL